MLEVVAARIWKDGRFLLCRRAEGKNNGGKWEFPGGKVEPGETKAAAIRREIAEELRLDIRPGGVVADVTHDCGDFQIHLTLFDAEIAGGALTLTEHGAAAFVTGGEAAAYALCPADRELLERLQNAQTSPCLYPPRVV